jgi:streptogramin lyase
VSGFDAISRLDPADGRVVDRIPTPGTGDYSRLAVGARSVWVTSTARGVVYRIDPRRDRVIAAVRLGGPVQGIAVGPGRVWATRLRRGPGQLIAIDPRDDRVTRPPIAVGPGPDQVVYALHDVWVQNRSPSSVMRVDPGTGRVTTVIGTTPVSAGSPGPGTIAVGHGSLWSAANGSLTRVDPVSGQVRSSVPIPRGVAVALGDGRVWVLAYPRSSSPTRFYPIKDTASLWEVDPGSGRVTSRPIRLGATQPVAITAGRHALWIADYASSTVTRLHLVLAGCGNGDSSSPSQRQDARLPNRFVDSARGVAVRYPAGWRVDQRPLTQLTSPRQLLVVSSFSIRQRRPDTNCTPTTAITELPATGALLFLLEQPHTPHSHGDSSFAKRPTRFRVEKLAAQPRECFGISRQIDFQTAGREFYLLAYFGPKASRHTEQLADRTLDSLVLHARTQRRG